MKTKRLIPILFFIVAFAITACAPAAPVELKEAAQPAVDTAGTAPAASQATETAPTVSSEVVEVSFSKDVWPILEKYALAAHGGKGGVFLESYSDVSKYVVAGKPEESMLYKALIGDGVKRMPPSAPLPDELIKTIYNWILQGAKDN